MAEHAQFAVRVPRGFRPRFASVYRPSPGIAGGPDRFGCCLPAEGLPAGVEPYSRGPEGHRSGVKERDGVRYAYAQSKAPPVVVPSGVGYEDRSAWDWWEHQLRRCDAMNLPRDFLLREMELVLIVRPYEWERQVRGAPQLGGLALGLEAVVVSHPYDDQELRRLVDDTRRAAREGLARA